MSGVARRAPVDLARALARFGDDARILQQAAASFLELAPGSWEKLRQAIERRDQGAVEFAAHRLRGQASTFDALDLVDAIRAIEEAVSAHARGGQPPDWGRADEIIPRLEPALAEALEALRKVAESD
jgi:HPt (histidine-containing phosphotransfer) domain-containing protein